MGKLNYFLVLFVAITFLLLFSIATQNEILTLILKPLIIPLILCYYFKEVIGGINKFLISILVFFFIADMLYLIDKKQFFEIGLVVYILPYLIILIYLYNDLKLLIKKRNYKKIDYSFMVVFVLLLVLFLCILSVLDIPSTLLFVLYVLLGLELVFMGMFTALFVYNSNNKKVFFLAISISCFIMSDLFFILKNNLFDLSFFKIINEAMQVLSYYFLVKYFLSKLKSTY